MTDHDKDREDNGRGAGDPSDIDEHGAPIEHAGHGGAPAEHADHTSDREGSGALMEHAGHGGPQDVHAGHPSDSEESGAPIRHAGHRGPQDKRAGHTSDREESGAPMEHSGHGGVHAEHAGHSSEIEESGAPMEHARHAGLSGHAEGHGTGMELSGHEQMFRNRFWVSLVLTVPVLLYSSTVQGGLNFTMPAFSGSSWVTPVFAVVIFLYCGVPFLRMAPAEIRKRRPGIGNAFAYSLRAINAQLLRRARL